MITIVAIMMNDLILTILLILDTMMIIMSMRDSALVRESGSTPTRTGSDPRNVTCSAGRIVYTGARSGAKGDFVGTTCPN